MKKSSKDVSPHAEESHRGSEIDSPFKKVSVISSDLNHFLDTYRHGSEELNHELDECQEKAKRRKNKSISLPIRISPIKLSRMTSKLHRPKMGKSFNQVSIESIEQSTTCKPMSRCEKMFGEEFEKQDSLLRFAKSTSVTDSLSMAALLASIEDDVSAIPASPMSPEKRNPALKLKAFPKLHIECHRTQKMHKRFSALHQKPEMMECIASPTKAVTPEYNKNTIPGLAKRNSSADDIEDMLLEEGECDPEVLDELCRELAIHRKSNNSDHAHRRKRTSARVSPPPPLSRAKSLECYGTPTKTATTPEYHKHTFESPCQHKSPGCDTKNDQRLAMGNDQLGKQQHDLCPRRHSSYHSSHHRRMKSSTRSPPTPVTPAAKSLVSKGSPTEVSTPEQQHIIHLFESIAERGSSGDADKDYLLEDSDDDNEQELCPRRRSSHHSQHQRRRSTISPTSSALSTVVKSSEQCCSGDTANEKLLECNIENCKEQGLEETQELCTPRNLAHHSHHRRVRSSTRSSPTPLSPPAKSLDCKAKPSEAASATPEHHTMNLINELLEEDGDCKQQEVQLGEHQHESSCPRRKSGHHSHHSGRQKRHSCRSTPFPLSPDTKSPECKGHSCRPTVEASTRPEHHGDCLFEVENSVCKRQGLGEEQEELSRHHRRKSSSHSDHHRRKQSSVAHSLPSAPRLSPVPMSVENN